MMSKVLYASMAALLVSGVAAEHHAATYVTNVASASASGSSSSTPGEVNADTESSTFAMGDDALAEATALSAASGEDWWGEGTALSLSESATEIADGGISVSAYADDFATTYGDWSAYADSDAEADGVVTIFKKYWEPEPAPEPAPEPCDGWWCHEGADGRRSLKEHHAATYVTNVASASASGSSSSTPGEVTADTESSTFAMGDDALAEATALSAASGEDWWGEGTALSLSESATEIADGGISVSAYADDFATTYGDWEAYADSDAEADGVVTIFKKYWEPEPAPEPAPEPCDGWWCHEGADGRRSLKEHHVETYVTNVASAEAEGSSSSTPGEVTADTESNTFAEGDDALAEATALSAASGEDWWGEGTALSLSESATEIADGGISVSAYADDFATTYGDWEAYADSDATASGAVLYHKYTKHEPEPAPEPVPEPCDGWWCHEDK